MLAPRSPHLAASPILRRAALPPREALLLLAVINHPWLLETHAEEFAELELRATEADRLRRAILDAGAGHQVTDRMELRAALTARDMGATLARIEAAITHASDWPARETAGPDDVACWWTHVVTLHRKSRTLNRELQEAEQALGREPSDANLTWLRDVQERLAALEGTEALIEGFGASSGRPVRTF